MIPAVRVENETYEQWLEAVAATHSIRNVEIPGYLLEHSPSTKATVATYGLGTVHVYNVVSPQLTRYLAEKPCEFQKKVVSRCVNQLNTLSQIGIKSVDLDIGLHRIDDRYSDSDITARVQILRDLIAGVSEESLMLSIPVRYPPTYPASREWDRAANIIHEVMASSCKLGVDVFPAEVAENEMTATVQRISYSAEFIRFHYEPRLGDTLDAWQAEAWMEQLRRYRFRGKIVFCPRVTNQDDRREACRNIDMLLDDSCGNAVKIR